MDSPEQMPPLPRTAIVAKPRNDTVAKAVDTAFAELAQLRHDRDEALAKMNAALDMCEKAKEFIRKQDQEIADLKSRNVVNQIERDEAVAKHAKLQGLFVAVQAQLRAFEIPLTPIINERISPDAESTGGTVDGKD